MRGAVHYDSYEDFLTKMEQNFKEMYRVLELGRYCCVNIADYTYEDKIYPIPFDFHHLLTEVGFIYEDDIIWQKPDGMSNSKRFGCFIQNPYPLYYHPAQIYEHILIFRKGREVQHYQSNKVDWRKYMQYKSNIWKLQPEGDNEHCAIFPEMLPELLITLYSYQFDTVLDPFLGSGTTMKVAINLNRNCIGYEIEPKYIDLIKNKVGWSQQELEGEIKYEIIHQTTLNNEATNMW
jgi:DNA modification methylase